MTICFIIYSYIISIIQFVVTFGIFLVNQYKWVRSVHLNSPIYISIS